MRRPQLPGLLPPPPPKAQRPASKPHGSPIAPRAGVRHGQGAAVEPQVAGDVQGPAALAAVDGDRGSRINGGGVPHADAAVFQGLLGLGIRGGGWELEAGGGRGSRWGGRLKKRRQMVAAKSFVKTSLAFSVYTCFSLSVASFLNSFFSLCLSFTVFRGFTFTMSFLLQLSFLRSASSRSFFPSLSRSVFLGFRSWSSADLCRKRWRSRDCHARSWAKIGSEGSGKP